MYITSGNRHLVEGAQDNRVFIELVGQWASSKFEFTSEARNPVDFPSQIIPRAAEPGARTGHVRQGRHQTLAYRMIVLRSPLRPQACMQTSLEAVNRGPLPCISALSKSMEQASEQVDEPPWLRNPKA